MNLIHGTIAYLSVVAAAAAVTVAGLASLERRQPESGATDGVARSSRVYDEPKVDPNRVPVWIAPTAKYDYTPVPIDPRPKRAPLVIGQDARTAMANVRGQSADGRRAIEQALGNTRVRSGQALGFTRSRDNDPFHRD